MDPLEHGDLCRTSDIVMIVGIEGDKLLEVEKTMLMSFILEMYKTVFIVGGLDS